mmetsp:Transcript_11563/g.33254  ORF Transcript_11563/g.33254 Transcript_11563/m.33254 type:complete len:216 (+) Transcript_11563:2671-3318(+)
MLNPSTAVFSPNVLRKLRISMLFPCFFCALRVSETCSAGMPSAYTVSSSSSSPSGVLDAEPGHQYDRVNGKYHGSGWPSSDATTRFRYQVTIPHTMQSVIKLESVVVNVYPERLSVSLMLPACRPMPASSRRPISWIPYANAATGCRDTSPMVPMLPSSKSATKVRKYPQKKRSNPNRVAFVDLEKKAEMTMQNTMVAVKVSNQNTKMYPNAEFS